MRKLIGMMMLFIATLAFAQTSRDNAVQATQKGTTMIGLTTSNLGFVAVEGQPTLTSLGLEAGQFIDQNFALVGKVGFLNLAGENAWTYGAGGKYYIDSQFPVQLDWNGSTVSTTKASTAYLGLQLGYAWAPFKNLTVEPRLRYDISARKADANVFSGGVGVNVHF